VGPRVADGACVGGKVGVDSWVAVGVASGGGGPAAGGGGEGVAWGGSGICDGAEAAGGVPCGEGAGGAYWMPP